MYRNWRGRHDDQTGTYRTMTGGVVEIHHGLSGTVVEPTTEGECLFRHFGSLGYLKASAGLNSMRTLQTRSGYQCLAADVVADKHVEQNFGRGKPRL